MELYFMLINYQVCFFTKPSMSKKCFFTTSVS